jgi:hypothetical protein
MQRFLFRSLLRDEGTSSNGIDASEDVVMCRTTHTVAAAFEPVTPALKVVQCHASFIPRGHLSLRIEAYAEF